EALVTCANVGVAGVYWLNPETQTWLRHFPGRPDISSLATLDYLQGVIMIGSPDMAPPTPATTPTPAPPPANSPTPTPTPSPTPTPATLIVAASDAAPQSKLGADFVCDGTADEVQINAAISAALAIGGGTVVLSEGTFVLGNSIVMASGVTLQGQGYSTLIQYDDTIAGAGAIGHHDGTTYRTVTDAAVRYLRIENTDADSEKACISIGWDDHIPQRITIDHVEADGCALYIWCGSNHRIEHCYVHDIRTGGTPIDCAIGIRGANATLAYDSLIANNFVDNISDMGIFSILSDGLLIVNNHIRDVNQRNPYYEMFAIDTATAVNVLIAENDIESSSGINSEGNTANANTGTVSIVGNIIKSTDNTTGIGIQVWRVAGGWPAFDNVLIQGNTVSGGYWGIHVGDQDKVAITGNLIDEVGDDGIRVDKAEYGVDPTAILIEGNTILDWAGITAWRMAIYAAVANVNISNNYLNALNVNNNERGISGLLNPGSITDNVIQNVEDAALFEIAAGVVVRDNVLATSPR
ncbi:MAG: right-handed parallel beta-helix repeat-containing protein, partial [Gammaproteobacteria bacterium]|nr:right-handed parallel beta-helix repeat-containing protein [Gammaproteobacteria bacterium]